MFILAYGGRMELERIIIMLLKDRQKPLKVGDIERITGVDRNTIQKVVNQLFIEEKVEVDRCYNKIIGLKGEFYD